MTQPIGTAGNVSQINSDFSGKMISGIVPQQREPRRADIGIIPVLVRFPSSFPDIFEQDIATYISLPEAPPNCFALEMAGESMAPGIMHGDYVLFVIDREAVPGDIVVANNAYGEAMIRRLKEKAGVSFLVSDNPSYPTFQLTEHFRIMGVVIAGWRQLKF